MFDPLYTKSEKGWVFAKTKAQSIISPRLFSEVKRRWSIFEHFLQTSHNL